jgi:hypothetical protein
MIRSPSALRVAAASHGAATGAEDHADAEVLLKMWRGGRGL